MKVTKCGATYGRFPRRLAGRGLTWAALAAMPLTVAIATMQPASKPVEAHRLVGLGCGPDRLTTTAVHEDEMLGGVQCDTIDTPRALCGHDDAADCAAYMGKEGW